MTSHNKAVVFVCTMDIGEQNILDSSTADVCMHLNIITSNKYGFIKQ